jgi:hypothetical protein
MSHDGLAARVNKLGDRYGLGLLYDHASVHRWIRDAPIARGRVPELICKVVSMCMNRTVLLADIGMDWAAAETAGRGSPTASRNRSSRAHSPSSQQACPAARASSPAPAACPAPSPPAPRPAPRAPQTAGPQAAGPTAPALAAARAGSPGLPAHPASPQAAPQEPGHGTSRAWQTEARGVPPGQAVIFRRRASLLRGTRPSRNDTRKPDATRTNPPRTRRCYPSAITTRPQRDTGPGRPPAASQAGTADQHRHSGRSNGHDLAGALSRHTIEPQRLLRREGLVW